MEEMIKRIWKKMEKSEDLTKDELLMKEVNDIDLNTLEFSYE